MIQPAKKTLGKRVRANKRYVIDKALIYQLNVLEAWNTAIIADLNNHCQTRQYHELSIRQIKKKRYAEI